MKSPSCPRITFFILASAVALAGGGCTKQARKVRLLARADANLDAGAFDKAEVQYNSARQLAPLDPVVIARLGLLYYDEGRLSHAYAFLKKAAELGLKDPQVTLRLGQTSLEMGIYKDARDDARTILASDPTNEEALVLLTSAVRTRADMDEAAKFVDGLRQANKDCAGYHLVQGRVLLSNRDLAGAEREVRSAIAMNPKSISAYGDLGNIFTIRRDAKQAGDAYGTAAELAPLRSAWRMRDIDFKLRTGKTDEAKAELADLASKAPDYVPALVLNMRLAMSQRRYDDCTDAIKKLLFRDPDNFDGVSERAVLKMAQNDVPGAIAEFKKAEELYPRSPQLKYQLALAYARTGDTARATDRLNQAVLLAPNYADAIIALANLNIRHGDADGAIAALSPLLEKAPQERPAYLLLAQAYLTEKKLGQAMDVYRRMAKGFPRDPEPLYRAGMILVQTGHRPEARKAFEAAVRIAPGSGPSLEMLVRLDLVEKHEDAAADRVRALIAAFPKSSGPWMLKGEIDLAAHRVDDAEADLHKAIELEPGAQTAYFTLARIYFATHKTKEAIDQLADLVARTKSVTAQMQIGAIHTALLQYDAAAADYVKVLSFDPKFSPALNNLAVLYSDHLNRVDDAYDLAKRAREAAPEDGQVADTLGWVLFKKGDFHGALDLIQESAGRAQDDPGIQYHLGMAHYMLGEEESARVAFEHVVAAPGDLPDKEQARSRLAFLALDPETAGPDVRRQLEDHAKTEPEDPVAAARLAAIEARFGTPATAAADFEAVLKLAPGNPQTMLKLAELYAGPLHQPDKARALAKSAHELAPDDPQTSATLGRLVYKTGDYQWSLDLLEEAARTLPHDPDLMYDLALGYYGVGRLPEADQALQAARSGAGGFGRRGEADRLASMIAAAASPASAEAAAGAAAKLLAADPDYLPALMISGLARQQEGDSVAAGAIYERILAKDPLFAPATRQLARIYVQRADDDDKAYSLAVKARAAFPNDPDVASTLGILDYRRGDYNAAARLFQESLGQRADDPETVYYLGMSHYNLRELEESKSELKHAIELKLPDREAEDAQRVLDEMKGDVQGPSLSTQPIN